jgi:deazaflavin-dependent oxidoreductase (nitroreductase family)
MSFDTPNGTRGRRQPGTLGRWANKFTMGRIRRKGKLGSMNALVLTTIGRKSGAERHTPVGRFPGKDGSWVIVASAAGGANNPAWYYNLAAYPDRAWIEMDGRKVAVTAEQLEGAEREEAWRQITTTAPNFAKYETATDRVIPVIRLTPRSN